jgi:hypothetical protein
MTLDIVTLIYGNDSLWEVYHQFPPIATLREPTIRSSGTLVFSANAERCGLLLSSTCRLLLPEGLREPDLPGSMFPFSRRHMT